MGSDLLRKYVTTSVLICYRSVVKHPFLVCMIILLFSLYRLFPFLFSVLLSVSPVIVSTFVLLGTLLSFGNPNIPEIEPESNSDHDEIRNHKLESKVSSETEVIDRDGNFGFEESNRDDNLVDDDVELRFKEQRVLDDEKVVLGSHYTPLKQSESVDRLWEGSADPLNSDPNLLWKLVEGNNDDDDEDEDEDDDGDDEGSDSGDEGSDMAESSSPDASMADIIPMLDELHPLLSEEQESREVPNKIDDVSEHSLGSSDSSSESNDDDGGNENHVDGEDEEDKEMNHVDKEDEIRSAIRWTEYDQKNLMNLGTSELERNRRLENLILRRRARKTMRMQAEYNLIDLESADIPWNIPPISTARNNPFDYDSNENIPGSAPSVMLQRRNPFDLPYDSSEEKPDLVGDTFQQEFAVVQPKEPFFRRHESFNVGPSIFAASRSERQETRMRPYFVPERSFAEFQRQFSGLSDSKVSSVPDTESVSSVGDLENKDNIEEDEQILEEKLVSEKDLQHASEGNGRPYFLPEQVASNETSFPSFQRQLSEVSDSKVSSVHDTESVSSDHENKDHIEEDEQILQAELVSEKDLENVFESDRRPYFLPEQVVSDGTSFTSFQRQLSEVSDSKASSAHDTESVSSAGDLENKDLIDLSGQPDLITLEDHEHDSDIRERVFEHDGNVDRVQVLEDEGIGETETDAIHMNLGDRELPRSMSSLSSSDSVSEQIYNAKESDEVATSVSETSDYFVDRVNSIETSEIDISSLVVEESHPKEPIYDLSPRSVTRNLSSSSILNGLHKDESFQHTDDQHQPSSSVANVEWTTDSSPETRDAQNQLPTVPNTEEHLLTGDSISSSLPNEPLLETDNVRLDTDTSHHLEQVQIPSSNSDERSQEGIHQEQVISQSENANSSFVRSLDKTSAENLEELQGREELEQGQVASSYGEPQFSEVVEWETYENPSEEEAISQLQREFPLLDTSTSEPAEENPEELQVQITSHNSDNLPMQEHENFSLNINSVSSAEPDVIEVADIETKASESPTYASDNFSIENNYVFDNIDDADEIDEDLLAELDAVGDFSVSDIESTLNDMQEDPHALEHDLVTRPTVDEDSSSGNLESITNEMKEEPVVSEHDLETNHSVDEGSFSSELVTTLNEKTQETHGLDDNIETNLSVDEDSYSKGLGSSLNEMTQESRGLEHDIETKLYGNEDSYSKDLGSTLNEMKQDQRASDDDLETKHSGDEDSYSKGEMKQHPHVSEHDLQTKVSGDEVSYSEDLGSTLDEIKQDPHESCRDLETIRAVDEDSYSKDSEFTFTEMKQDPHESNQDLETKRGLALDEMKQDPDVSEQDPKIKRAGDEDSFSNDLGLTLDGMKQDPDVSEHDLETKRAGDEVSFSNDSGLALDEMKQDPDVSEHDLEIKRTGDEDSFSNDLGLTLDEVKQGPDASEHDLEIKLSGDEDFYSKNSESTFNEIRQVPQVSEHRLETFYSVDENFYSKHVESTLNEMKQAQQATDQDLETNRSGNEDPHSNVPIETKIQTDAEVIKSQNEKETSNTEVAAASEVNALKLINDASEVVLPQQTKSTTFLTSSASATMVNHGTENVSFTSNADNE